VVSLITDPIDNDIECTLVGLSVAKAKEARASMIRLIHNIWIGVNISDLIVADPMIVIPTPTTFTVN